MNVRYAWGQQGAGTFYAKISHIYLNLENLLSDEISDELELLLLRRAVRLSSETTRLPKLKSVQCRPSEFGKYPVLSRARVELRRTAGTQ